MFGKSPEIELFTPPRASVREVLWFDVSDHEASTDLALAERRLTGWTFAPWLLLAGHLIVTIALAFEQRHATDSNALWKVVAPLGHR